MPEIEAVPDVSVNSNGHLQLDRPSTSTAKAAIGKASGATAQEHSGAEYADFFDVREYVRSRFGGGVENPNSCQPLSFQMRGFHEFYELFHSRWDPSSARLLEFGGGPSIYPLISACRHVSEIVFTDYTASLLREARLWSEKDPMAHDWGEFFRYQVNRLEGKGGQEAVAEREDLLRERITSFYHCDITSRDPIDRQLGKFDIVSTSYCLEAVAGTIEEFRVFLKRLANVTNLGGYVVLQVSIGMTRYRLSGEDFKHLGLSLDDTRACLDNAGYVVAMERYYPLEDYRREIGQSDCQGKAVFAGQRVR